MATLDYHINSSPHLRRKSRIKTIDIKLPIVATTKTTVTFRMPEKIQYVTVNEWVCCNCSKFNKFTSRNIFKTQENCKKCAHTGCHECQDTETEYRVEGKKMSGESGGVR